MPKPEKLPFEPQSELYVPHITWSDEYVDHVVWVADNFGEVSYAQWEAGASRATEPYIEGTRLKLNYRTWDKEKLELDPVTTLVVRGWLMTYGHPDFTRGGSDDAHD